VVVVAVFVGAFVVAGVVVSQVALGVYLVPTGSMAPTIPAQTYVDVNKLDTGASRGAIVILRAPASVRALYPGLTDVVRRVLAVGGDTISCCQSGHVVLNGEKLYEPYVPTASGLGPQDSFRRVHVQSGFMFVAGDYRWDSLDSRRYGPVPTSLIVGRVEGPRGWMASAFRWLVAAFLALVVTIVLWFAVLRRAMRRLGSKRISETEAAR
jgi:signal peptidase I